MRLNVGSNTRQGHVGFLRRLALPSLLVLASLLITTEGAFERGSVASAHEDPPGNKITDWVEIKITITQAPPQKKSSFHVQVQSTIVHDGHPGVYLSLPAGAIDGGGNPAAPIPIVLGVKQNRDITLTTQHHDECTPTAPWSTIELKLYASSNNDVDRERDPEKIKQGPWDVSAGVVSVALSTVSGQNKAGLSKTGQDPYKLVKYTVSYKSEGGSKEKCKEEQKPPRPQGSERPAPPKTPTATPKPGSPQPAPGTGK